MCQNDEIKRLREENRSLREVIRLQDPKPEQPAANPTYKEVTDQVYSQIKSLDAIEQKQTMLDLQYRVYSSLGMEVFEVNLTSTPGC